MNTMVRNFDLADELITRLNELISDDTICKDVQRLIGTRVQCSASATEHFSIQTKGDLFGFLGLLNGIVGAFPDSNSSVRIAAEYDDDGMLVKFRRANVELVS